VTVVGLMVLTHRQEHGEATVQLSRCWTRRFDIPMEGSSELSPRWTSGWLVHFSVARQVKVKVKHCCRTPWGLDRTVSLHCARRVTVRELRNWH